MIYRYSGLGVWLLGLRYQARFEDKESPLRVYDDNVYARTYSGVLRALAARIANQNTEPLGFLTGLRSRQTVVAEAVFEIREARKGLRGE